MTAAEQIKAARAARGLTQPQAASLIGVPLRTLQNWEIGHRAPPAFTLRAVLERLEPAERDN